MREHPSRSSQRPPFRALLAVLVVALLPGCVTVYEPLLGLQRPVVLSTEARNFDGQKILVRCIPGAYVPPQDMDRLCRGVRTSLANQGAEVEVRVPRGSRRGAPDREEGEAAPDLVIDLSARLLHEDNIPILWLLSYVTLTLVPAISETTFAQDISIRDGQGVLLASDSLQGRFIQYFGAGIYLVNFALDSLVRKESEKISEEASKKDFSKDFYGQLSQLAFHARTRAQVLRGEFPGAPKEEKR